MRPLGFALGARATFFLRRQEESSQRRRRPWSTPRYAGFLALLGWGGGCGTRRYAAQTVLALYPPQPVLLSVSQGARKSVASDIRCLVIPAQAGIQNSHPTPTLRLIYNL